MGALARVNRDIVSGGLPKDLCPMVFAVTGTGRVSMGCMEVLEQLPHVKVAAKDLHSYCADPENKKNNKHVVLCQFGTADLVRHKEGKPYNKDDYRQNPGDYTDCFKDYLDCVNWLVNGIYWEAKYPLVISRKDLKAAVEAGTSKLMGVTDISADYEGSCALTTRFTSIEEPFLLYDPISETHLEKIGDFY